MTTISVVKKMEKSRLPQTPLQSGAREKKVQSILLTLEKLSEQTITSSQ